MPYQSLNRDTHKAYYYIGGVVNRKGFEERKEVMTKLEILDNLQILKESLKGQSKNHYRKSDGPEDYDFGYGQACETYAERVESLYLKVKEDVERSNKCKA